MEKNGLLATALALMMSATVAAQKMERYQESYNYKRAVEILDSDDGDENEALKYL